MEAEEREKLLQQSSTLRLELKVWEREFTAANGGRKAGRDDIKQHPAIAQKYKDYNRIRDILSGKIDSRPTSSPQKGVSRKRKYEKPEFQTPSKRLQTTEAPSKSSSHPAVIDPYDSPSLVRKLFTPSQNKVIGPTPQKDGQVLGLFDLLSEGEESPLKGQVTITAPESKMHSTPHKPARDAMSIPSTTRHSRTPASSGKRFMLNSFVTPLKGRHPDDQAGKTPSSVSKLHFATPLFLRRDSHRAALCPIQENGDSLTLSPELIRLPRKPLVRGLSTVLAGLRKMEEEAADEDLDALREMENEISGTFKPVARGTLPPEDSKVPVLLGGFDNEAMYDSEPEEVENPPLGRDGQPLKIRKKKGQKRTTRRVVIKPVRKTKAQPVIPQAPCGSSDELTQLDEDELVTEMRQQAANSAKVDASGNLDSDSGSEYASSGGGTRYRHPNQLKLKKTVGGKGEGKVKKVTRKVGAMAHANFKRLKLRNSGSKGGVSHNSRFRRRT